MAKQYKELPLQVDVPFMVMRGDELIEHCFVHNQHGTLVLTNGVDRDAVVTTKVMKWLSDAVQSGRVFHKE